MASGSTFECRMGLRRVAFTGFVGLHEPVLVISIIYCKSRSPYWKGMHLYVRKLSTAEVQTFQVDVAENSSVDELRAAVRSLLKQGPLLNLFAPIQGEKVMTS